LGSVEKALHIGSPDRGSPVGTSHTAIPRADFTSQVLKIYHQN